MTSVFRSLLPSFLVLSAALLLGTSSAFAAPPAVTPTPLQCFAQWEGNSNYVGDGWVAARVRQTSGTILGCGDEQSGVIHIGHPDTTGSQHPITAETEQAFLACFDSIAVGGSREPDPEFPQTRTRYRISYYAGTVQGIPFTRSATFIRDNSGGFVWSMFTSTSNDFPDGNNWVGCSRSDQVA